MTSVNKFSDLPEFPKMRTLEIADYQLFVDYCEKYPQYSDFNFISLWGYDTKNDCQISAFKKNLIIRMHDYITGEPLYTFIGESAIIETVKEIFLVINKNRENPIIKLLPEICIKNIAKTDSIRFEEDRDNFDYIYSIKKLADLKGSAMHKIKNYVNRFKVLYPGVSIIKLNITKPDVQKEIMYLFDHWQKNKPDARHEKSALLRTLKSAKQLPKIFTVGLIDQERLIGFIIIDVNNNHYSQGHFAKAKAAEYKGVYPYLYYVTAQFLLSKDIQFLNLEQDLGIEGIRKTKEQLKPEFYLKKYIVVPQ